MKFMGVAAGFDEFQDNSLVLAVDDPPEEGLDSPLRLEKLANEVRPFYVSCSFSLWSVYDEGWKLSANTCMFCLTSNVRSYFGVCYVSPIN